jgi:hypothetical protein
MDTDLRDDRKRGDGGAAAWYARPELAGPWRISACAEHGRMLERHRFEKVGAVVDFPGRTSRPAESCAVCHQPGLLREVERCTCEHDSARCPEHQNVGCGG